MIHKQSPIETGKSIKQEDTLAFPIDNEAFVRGIPENALDKGFFSNQFIEVIEQNNPTALPQYLKLYPEKFPAFRDVSLKISTRRFFETACLAFPELPPAEAMRRVARQIYPQILGTMLGKVIFAMLGKDIVSILRNGPRAFELFEKNGTRATFSLLSHNHCRYDFEPSYNLIEATQVGIFEGAALYCGFATEITVQRTDWFCGSLECRWTK
jgi:hypothetical protein